MMAWQSTNANLHRDVGSLVASLGLDLTIDGSPLGVD
jgi:hypothetical protein